MTTQARQILRRTKKAAKNAAASAVHKGLSPSWFRYHFIEHETLTSYGERKSDDPRVKVNALHPAKTESNPYPINVTHPDELPDDAGWWGYSFQDVPERKSGPTILAEIPNARIVPRIDSKGEFWVGVLNEDNRACQIREMALRPEHRSVILRAETEQIDQAVWLLERVYDNYSHWFTAHMPKFLLARELGIEDKVLLPKDRPRFIDHALELYGFDPTKFPTFDPSKILKIKRLTILDTDRFRPDLLRRVRESCPNVTNRSPQRRIFISRENATRRRLLNEDQLIHILDRYGFERVAMESFSLAQQVQLMQETAILCAPHGAGLTNMMFCNPGTRIIEAADLGFPNPNFYALACAMKHDYWLISAEGVGDVHPLEKDMKVDPLQLEKVLAAATSNCPAPR